MSAYGEHKAGFLTDEEYRELEAPRPYQRPAAKLIPIKHAAAYIYRQAIVRANPPEWTEEALFPERYSDRD